jgi:hypothetical protein
LRFVILTPGVANADGSNEVIMDIFKAARSKCSLAKIKINGPQRVIEADNVGG